MDMSNFPFTIGDVARLCHLNVSRENQTSEYIVCPFCGRKKMNLHYGKGLYHCPACDAGGSMLKLYAELRGFQGSKGEIVKEIKKELGIKNNSYYRSARQSENAVALVQPQIDFERMKRLDFVYRAFLNKLFLARVHKPYLYRRGLSDEDIERFGFKSMPLFGYKALCCELLQENIRLENVGGFYLDEGEWTINLNPKMTGYLIPVYNYFGFIEGIQIRLDRPSVWQDEVSLVFLQRLGSWHINSGGSFLYKRKSKARYAGHHRGRVQGDHSQQDIRLQHHCAARCEQYPGV